MRIESYFFAENLSKRSFCKMAKQDCIACPRLVINFETIQNILNCRKLHFRHSNQIHKNPQISSESDVQQGYTYLCISFPWDGSRLNLPCLYLPGTAQDSIFPAYTYRHYVFRTERMKQTKGCELKK